jgi:hypothetical protein
MNKLRFLSDTLNKSHGIRPNYTARANFEMHGTFFYGNACHFWGL